MESEVNITPAEVTVNHSNKTTRRKPVQVVLTDEEYSLVRSMADRWGTSVPGAIRRSIHRSEWLDRLTRGGGQRSWY